MNHVMSLGKKIAFLILTGMLSLVAAAILAEYALGVMERRQAKRILDYGDMMRKEGLGFGGYLQENVTKLVTDGLGGEVRWTNNALGFRSDGEFSRHPEAGVLRILLVGDSFNAGYRVGQHETFAYLEDQWINRNLGKAEVMIAETEEPGTALYYLDQFGLQLKPHIVILGITLGNDIAQVCEALDPNGRYNVTISNGQAHIGINPQATFYFELLRAFKFPPEYLQSRTPSEKVIRGVKRWIRETRLLRIFYQQHEPITTWGDHHNLSLFDITNGLGMFTVPPPPMIEVAYQRLFRVLEACSLTCQQHGIIFAVQIFPQRYQVQPDDWEQAVEEYDLKKSRFDLMAPNRRITAFCREHNIWCIDPTAAMAQRYAETRKTMYLPMGDMHWNKEGQRAFFECSLPALMQGVLRQGFQAVQAHKANAGYEPKTSAASH
jgi:hypothetical protein